MPQRLIFDLPTPDATDRLAEWLAAGIRAGDTLLLEGPIGAGKSHLARALIRARLGNPDEEVPSPTFTLVQTYPADPPVWHADLYRLTHPDEALELGLEGAFENAIVLVEWPERLGSALPEKAIRLRLEPAGEGRRAEIALTDRPELFRALHAHAETAFLTRVGWEAAEHHPLAGDASARHFIRLNRGGGSAVLLDNPPGLPDRLDDFLRMDRHLAAIGLSAPEILAEDRDNGFLLMEDFGDALMSRRLANHPEEEAELYRLATNVLIEMQAHPAPPGLPDLTAQDWAEAAMLCLSEYCAGALGEPADPAPLCTALTEALHRWGDGPRVLIHRDYFASNILLLPRPGLKRAGLIDFQLGQLGQPVYDLVSLLQDARRDVSPEVEAAMKTHFAAATRAGEGFEAAYAVWGTQRALRILGVFARLCRTEGRAEYLAHLPRVMRDLRRNLKHPALAALNSLCEGLLPDPTPDILNRLEAQCGPSR